VTAIAKGRGKGLRLSTAELITAFYIALSPFLPQLWAASSSDAPPEELASQCGFQCAYLAIRSCCQPADLPAMLEDYRGDAAVEVHGLSLEQLTDLIRRHGLNAEDGLLDRHAFSRLSFDDHVLIALMQERHYQVVLRGTPSQVLTVVTEGPVWMDRDRFWEQMQGPVVLVHRAAHGLLVAILGLTAILLGSAGRALEVSAHVMSPPELSATTAVGTVDQFCNEDAGPGCSVTGVACNAAPVAEWDGSKWVCLSTPRCESCSGNDDICVTNNDPEWECWTAFHTVPCDPAAAVAFCTQLSAGCTCVPTGVPGDCGTKMTCYDVWSPE